MEEPLMGFEFEEEEESVFEGGCRGRTRASSLPYSARRCEPEWFCKETNCRDEAETFNIKKFRGDLAYKCQEFKKALAEYSDCLALLPFSNLAMRRDVLESQARCLAHLRRPKEALAITEKLRNGATNTDHVTAVLGLQLAIFHTLEHTEKRVECLQQLITLHPFHPGSWKLLAEAYMRLLKSPELFSESETALLQCRGSAGDDRFHISSAESVFRCHKKNSLGRESSLPFLPETNGSLGSCEECQRIEGLISPTGKSEPWHKITPAECDPMEKFQDVWIYACASFVRSRLLFQLTESNQSSFALERNLKVQQEIEDQLKSLGLKENALSLVTEASGDFMTMGEDLVPEKLKEDAQGEVKCVGASALASILSAAAGGFERKWFGKLQEHFSHLDCWM